MACQVKPVSFVERRILNGIKTIIHEQAVGDYKNTGVAQNPHYYLERIDVLLADGMVKRYVI